jgi:hypothetical protein
MLQFLTALVSFFSLLETGGGLNPDGLSGTPPQGETGGGLSPDGRS